MDNKKLVLYLSLQREIHTEPHRNYFIRAKTGRKWQKPTVRKRQAEVLGIAERTMERWLLKLVQSADIERIEQGIYKKVALKNASA